MNVVPMHTGRGRALKAEGKAKSAQCWGRLPGPQKAKFRRSKQWAGLRVCLS